MQIERLTRIDQIQPGDTLLISNGTTITPATAHRVKVSDFDGTEVIFDVKRNKYFNVGMYLEGASWAKDVRVVRMPSNVKVRGWPPRTAANVRKVASRNTPPKPLTASPA